MITLIENGEIYAPVPGTPKGYQMRRNKVVTVRR
jgi:hypothetical protein